MKTEPKFQKLWPFPGLKQHYTITLALAGLVAFAAAWSFKINTNLFFMVYLTCGYVILQLLVVRPSLRVALLVVFLFLLSYSPTPIPALPEQIRVSADPWPSRGKVVSAGETRNYRFLLAPLRDRQRECGSLQRVDIYVHVKFDDGADRAVLSVDRGSIEGQDQSPFYAGYTIIRGHAKLPSELPHEVVVGLRNPGNEPFQIFLGPEIAKDRVYPEAVYMKFETPECVVVAHATPVD